MRTTTLIFASAAAVAISFSASAAPVGSESAAGYWIGGTLNVSPFMSISYARDDNPNSLRDYSKATARRRGLDDQTKSANTLVLKGGLNFLMPGNHWRLDGRAFAHYESSSGADVDDRTDFSEYLIYRGWTDAGTSWYLSERYQDIRFDDEYELSQNDRKVLTLAGGGDMALTDKSMVILGARYSDLDYEKENNYDYSVLRGKLGFAHILTEKTDWTAVAGYRTYDKDNYDCNAWSVNGSLGVRTRSTDKVTFDTSVGAEFYRDYKYAMYAADGTYLGKKSKGEDEKSFVYNIGANWKIAKRLSLRVFGDAEYEPSDDINDNSYFEKSIGATLNYTPGDHWKFSAGASYERDDYNRKVVSRIDSYATPYSSVEKGGKKRTDDKVRCFAKASYALTRYCALFAAWTYTDTNSSISGYDYDRTRYSAGISLKY